MLTQFPRSRLLLLFLVPTFLVMLMLRLGFYWYFLSGSTMSSADLWQAMSIGMRFDLRIALFLTLPLAIISLLPGVLGLNGKIGRPLALLLTVAGIVGIALFYIFDFGHYAYLGERLNASVLEFLEDGSDTWQMLWESYPVVGMVVLMLSTCLLSWAVVSYLINRVAKQLKPVVWWRFAAAAPIVLAAYFYGIIGKVDSVVPLRWSDVFFTDDQQASSLAHNPLVFFTATLQNKSRPYDPKILKATYMDMANYLGVDNPSLENLNFVRKAEGKALEGRRPNVVFIHLESLGANRSGLYGNELGATPFMDKIAKEGYFFPNFLVPASGTARTVFGLITGIPDVTWGGSTATRNPLISQQYTLVNAFEGYKKFYFIGGDAGWANVQGLLQHSIPELELWQERDYNVPVVDVWGISDNNLFKAANKRLNELPEEQPFVAFIQLAGNHRPFTIPNEDIGFETTYVSDEELFKYGFNNLAHYNAVRLQDYNLQQFFTEMAGNSHYANNTIYLMYGDHNTRSVLPTVMDIVSEPLNLNNHHVPFIIYAPGVIQQPEVREQVASLVDLIPTALGMAGLPYENRTMGRDLFAWQGEEGYIMTFGGSRSKSPTIGLMTATDFLSMLYNGKEERFYKLTAPKDNVAQQHKALVEQRKHMLHGFYQTATYMLTHNSPKKEH